MTENEICIGFHNENQSRFEFNYFRTIEYKTSAKMVYANSPYISLFSIWDSASCRRDKENVSTYQYERYTFIPVHISGRADTLNLLYLVLFYRL